MQKPIRWNKRHVFLCILLVFLWTSVVIQVTYRLANSNNPNSILRNNSSAPLKLPLKNTEQSKNSEQSKTINIQKDTPLYKDFFKKLEEKFSKIPVPKQEIPSLKAIQGPINDVRISLNQVKEALVYMRDASMLYKNDYHYGARRDWMDKQLQSLKEGNGLAKIPSKYLLIDDIDVDPEVHYKMIIMVFSHSEENYERRASIRRLWGNPSIWKTKEKFKLIFMLGGIHEKSMMRKVYEESKLHRDILLESVPEGFYTTSSKLAICMHWLSLQDWKYDFVVKADDDVFIHLDNLMQKVSKTDPKEPHYYGSLNGKPKAIRGGRYKITKIEHPADTFNGFVPGATVIMTKVVLMKIAPYFNFVNPMKFEDVYLANLVIAYGGTKAVETSGVKLDLRDCTYKSGLFSIHPVKTTKCMESLTKGALAINR